MGRRYIISLTGANRVGILAAVTTALDELRGNLWEANISVMPPFCSILLTADFPEGRTADIVSDHIRDLCRPYAVEVRLSEPNGEGRSSTPATPTAQHMLTVHGSDKPGMLRLLSNKLSELGIDIHNLYAERCDQDATFTMELELAIPTSLDIAHVREEVSGRCREVGLDLTLEPAEEFFARCGRNLRDAVRAGAR
ncbi:MAG TPA: ACT domain-containing protein [Planctomycetaceae bacterium]|nr:ACT domain-containing protein [Planctomycetaceae bacterium]